jgi:hypothetical protein
MASKGASAPEGGEASAMEEKHDRKRSTVATISTVEYYIVFACSEGSPEVRVFSGKKQNHF